ncbi:alpha/beta fold hydrolase [Zhongshania sp.]|uniref:alpha/beta fold hydrolase n=1 Tax=Zhongshania sp. TaxID=1971902 RepID=UPI00356250FC
MRIATPPSKQHFLAPYHGQKPAAPAWYKQAVACVPERTFFSSMGANIELLTWGKVGAPGLLFLHGHGAHADWWTHIAPFFADQWRCAALSYSGMGRSEWRADGYQIDDFVQEAQDTVNAAQLNTGPTPPIIIGHSFGGAVGIRLAAKSSSFGGLIAIDTPINVGADLLEKFKTEAPKTYSEHLRFDSLKSGLSRFRLSPAQPCDNHFIADYIARCALEEHNDGWSWRFDPRRVEPDNKPDHEIFPQIRCPIAYIYGDRSSLVTSQSLQNSLKVFPKATPLVAIPDAAHHVLIDQPLALVSSLRALLACWPPQHNFPHK